MEHAVARLNDSGLGDIDQLAVHEVQESAWNIGGALRKHVGRQGCAVKGKVMASSSANVEAPPMAGVQVTEGPLAAEVPAGIFFPHPGALSSNAGANAGDTNAASAEDTNGAAGALCELLPMKLGIRGGPCWPPVINACNPSIKVGTMAVIVAPSWSRTCSSTISGIRATCALSS